MTPWVSRIGRVVIALAALIAAVALGVRTSSFWDLWLIPKHSVRCAGGVCVGDSEAKVGDYLSIDYTGGLKVVACLSEPNADDIFIPALLAGRRCALDHKLLGFQTGGKRTDFEVAHGRVIKITVGPAHDLDL